ncbi:MAG: MoxR family ATPase [Lentisphaerae bacterium]|jgi:MoxR-like ATPase|nr:MoxR family ATPase [Lentisphaerota bacterium]
MKSHKELTHLRHNLDHVIRGKQEAIELLLAGVLANGHLLLEDVPGTGKTTLAKALAISLDASFARIQFTPDLLPTDILGGMVYRPHDGSFSFRPGPIFAHIVLADEINRASPRTQSALLEAMAEQQVSIEGETRRLPHPFMVLATQNPVEYNGTYPLPEAQLDRFALCLSLGYPDRNDEVAILQSSSLSHPLHSITTAMDIATLAQLQHEVREIGVEDSVLDYIVRLVQYTRNDARLRLGASPRASLDLRRCAQARAWLADRDHVRPEDVQALAISVLAHRLAIDIKAGHGGLTGRDIVMTALNSEAVPQ